MSDKKLSEVDQVATQRVLKARTELIMSHRFYGVLVSNVEPVLSRQFPTMATDSKRHFFNPDFISKLSQEELVTVQLHESEHDARHHSTRRNGRDPLEWNIACDLAINIDLHDQGRKFPPKEVIEVYLDPKYRGMSAEDIYRCRELDRQAEEEKRRQQADTDPGKDDDDDQADDTGDEAGDDEADSNEGDGKAGDEAEDGEDTGDGGNETADAGDDTGDAGEEAGSEADGDDAGDEAGDANGNGGKPSDEDSAEAGEVSAPGTMGDVIDAGEEAGEVSEQDAKWDRIVRQAASISTKHGDLPGHITREIDRANRPTQNWREVLRAYIDGGAKKIETWNRPNRRFIGAGLYLPGLQRDGLNKVVFIVDTSGSMDHVALKCINTEMQAALDDGAIDELIVVYGDTRVTRTDTYREGDNIEFDPRGGGGTDMKPMFQWVRENLDDVSLIINFTDLYIGDAGEQPDCPVLFAVTGYPHVVRELIANAPWGAPGIDVGEH